MSTQSIQTESIGLKAKLSDYNQLIKFRLTFTVVLSSVLGYLIGYTGSIDWSAILALSAGGLLVVASSNGINQIIEKNYQSNWYKLFDSTYNFPHAMLIK